MVLGYVAVPYNQLNLHKEKILSLRDKHHFYNEIKWTNISESGKHFYFELIDYFFSTEISFRAVIINKEKFKDQDSSNYDDFYYKMYYQLIYHKLDMHSRYNIYLDIKDDLGKYKIIKLKQVLNTQYGIIRNLQLIRSHESSFIQLCDILIGAISYYHNDVDKKVIAKNQLIEKIIARSECSFDKSTYLSESKFNLFLIDLL
jgi:hypothetical protein